MIESAHTLTHTITRQAQLNYLLYLPENYETHAQWPLVMFLHGRGERGDDLETVKYHGLPREINEGKQFPFIAVAPQCPVTSYWTEELDSLAALLDKIQATYNVDKNRIYLTGMSMGGRGTWYLAGRYPERFAAIAPVCGSGLSWQAQERLTTMPVWTFHGTADTVVHTYESENMVQWLREAGNDQVKLTLYPGLEHDCWTVTYSNPELYEWLLSHQRT